MGIPCFSFSACSWVGDELIHRINNVISIQNIVPGHAADQKKLWLRLHKRLAECCSPSVKAALLLPALSSAETEIATSLKG